MVDPARSRIMRAGKGRDTGPEMKIRCLIFAMGYRYRLHRKDLPGKPDLVFPSRRKVVFIHGCFWHGHDCRRGARIPKTNRDYWEKKIAGNRERDDQHYQNLISKGWAFLVIWECGMSDSSVLENQIKAFLGEPGRSID